jgi:L-seryl-tRNA(Ser) seleniumtransferase
MSVFRVIPSIEELLRRPALDAAIRAHGGDLVTAAARRAAEELRARLTRGGDPIPSSADDAAGWLESRTLSDLEARLAPSLRSVINATGVIVHTNLGRAPLAAEALARVVAVASEYSNLEFTLDQGRRGHRHVHAERLLCDLTGAEAAIVVNNNAAAVLLVLAALAAGREAIVSRGELVEIGGGFRVPDVMAQSGVVLREVGTTNRTRVNDYAAAINDRTALLLRVHPSNFRIEGFTERPPLAELSAIAKRFGLPLVEDLGSGWLGGSIETPPGLRDEPSVAASIDTGADIVAFSGDKLLGGPQAGIVAGRRDLIERVRTHPLMRAVRADKQTYAALEATLALWTRPAARRHIPVYRMLAMTVDEIERRARAVAGALAAVDGLECRIVDGESTVGGGSAPGSTLPTRLIALRRSDWSAAALEAELRGGDPPIIARIQDDAVVLDLRTVSAEHDARLVGAIRG